MQEKVELKITWEQAVDQFDNLIKFAARQQIENNTVDSAVSAEDLYQEGMIKLYDCWVKWCVERGKDMDEFGPIFRKSLFRKVKQCGKRQKSMVDIDAAANILEDTNSEDTVERMHREEGLDTLKGILSNDIAKQLLAELIQPSARTLFEAHADKQRKEMLKSQGHKVNVPKDNTVRMKHIKKSLGISTKQYDTAMTEIREKAKLALQV
jgi:hypothetical protein